MMNWIGLFPSPAGPDYIPCFAPLQQEMEYILDNCALSDGPHRMAALLRSQRIDSRTSITLLTSFILLTYHNVWQ
jgi:hypothetical protein